MSAPVLLIGFNRPDFMRDQIAAVRAGKPSKLYIAVDGPREGRPDEAAKCAAVRDCVKLIDWPCKIKTLFREKNLGCKYGVCGAITWFFENEEMGIVLEDDCRPSPDFFRFASEMLVRYKDDERIGAICGFNFFNLQTDSKASYHFSSHMDVWGWASWRRVWARYDVEMKPYLKSYSDIIRQSKMTPYYKRILKSGVEQIKSGLSTWDIQFSLAFLANNFLSIVPKQRLVINAGLNDSAATHTGGFIYFSKDWTSMGTCAFPLCHPATVSCDEKSDRIRERMEGAIFPRALTWLGCKVSPLRKALAWIGSIAETLVPLLFRI